MLFRSRAGCSQENPALQVATDSMRILSIMAKRNLVSILKETWAYKGRPASIPANHGLICWPLPKIASIHVYLKVKTHIPQISTDVIIINFMISLFKYRSNGIHEMDNIYISAFKLQGNIQEIRNCCFPPFFSKE